MNIEAKTEFYIRQGWPLKRVITQLKTEFGIDSTAALGYFHEASERVNRIWAAQASYKRNFWLGGLLAGLSIGYYVLFAIMRHIVPSDRLPIIGFFIGFIILSKAWDDYKLVQAEMLRYDYQSDILDAEKL